MSAARALESDQVLHAQRPLRLVVRAWQYTSGSTSEPKGVMITHGNLTHNLRCIVKALSAGCDTVVVSWLPQYHDMGLIGSYLGCLYCGGTGGPRDTWG
jgi:acyl-CoA synthetase (AMP-forming)/AMP-acid ligase II